MGHLRTTVVSERYLKRREALTLKGFIAEGEVCGNLLLSRPLKQYSVGSRIFSPIRLRDYPLEIAFLSGDGRWKLYEDIPDFQNYQQSLISILGEPDLK